jgi:S-adenosylmethionine:tRNA ribosyltransferase-isomerase
VRPGRRLPPGSKVLFGDLSLTGLIVGVLEDSGGRLVQLSASDGRVQDAVRRVGEVPLPPYVTAPLADPELYQTVFGTDEHSAAAPTAGLHFTQALLDRIQEAGAHVARVELDVGLDTFRPVTEDIAEQHHIHTERFRVPAWTADAVNACRRRGGRVFAVGTTVVRALESSFSEEQGAVVEAQGATDLFILPGFKFGAVDALVTNFHVPRSTLLMMVSAFAGRELVLDAYELAKAQGYRFLSFGDAMLFV